MTYVYGYDIRCTKESYGKEKNGEQLVKEIDM